MLFSEKLPFIIISVHIRFFQNLFLATFGFFTHYEHDLPGYDLPGISVGKAQSINFILSSLPQVQYCDYKNVTRAILGSIFSIGEF